MIIREIASGTDEEVEDFLQNTHLWLENNEFKVVMFKAFGLTSEEILDILNNSYPIINSYDTGFQIYQVQRAGRPELFIELLEDLNLSIRQVDNLKYLWIYRNSESDNFFEDDKLREKLFPYFSEKITKRSKLIIGESIDKPIFTFVTGGFRPLEIMKEILPLYQDWFMNNSNLISPQFQEIKAEISTWLERQYKIIPQQKGFITWYIHKKLDKAFKIHFNIKHKEGSDMAQADITFDYSAISETLLPTIIDQHLHEYCEYRRQQQEEIVLANVKPKQLSQPISKNPESTLENKFPTDSLFEIMLPPCQSRFIELEKKLIEKGYFGDYGQWKESTLSLAAFIYILKEGKNLIKPNITSYVPLRKFFNKRYKVEIPVDYTKPGRMKPGKNSKIKELLSLLEG